MKISPKSRLVTVNSYECWIISLLVAEQGIEQQQYAANHNGGIGNIEVRPVVVNDVHFEKIDHVAVAQAIVRVAKGAARMSASAIVVALICAQASSAQPTPPPPPQRKDQQHPAHPRRRTGIIEEAEGRAWILHMADGEDMGNHLT